MHYISAWIFVYDANVCAECVKLCAFAMGKTGSEKWFMEKHKRCGCVSERAEEKCMRLMLLHLPINTFAANEAHDNNNNNQIQFCKSIIMWKFIHYVTMPACLQTLIFNGKWKTPPTIAQSGQQGRKRWGRNKYACIGAWISRSKRLGER